MAAKLCKELQILFGNNMKYSDFIDGDYLVCVNEIILEKANRGYSCQNYLPLTLFKVAP